MIFALILVVDVKVGKTDRLVSNNGYTGNRKKTKQQKMDEDDGDGNGDDEGERNGNGNYVDCNDDCW